MLPLCYAAPKYVKIMDLLLTGQQPSIESEKYDQPIFGHLVSDDSAVPGPHQVH